MSNPDFWVSSWHHYRQREITAELLGSLFLMHNTCVHSFVYLAGVFTKPYDSPQTKNLNAFQVKNLLSIYKLAKQKACNLSLLQITHIFFFTKGHLYPSHIPLFCHLFALLPLKFHGPPSLSTQTRKNKPEALSQCFAPWK